MCKRGGLLITYQYVEHRALITDADCDSWQCPECQERLKDYWLLHAQHGASLFLGRGVKLFFATITSHENTRTFSQGASIFPDAWGKLHKRLNRTSDICEYLLIPEHHKDGRLHMHAVWTFPVDTRWLKDNGRECGFGFMNQIWRKHHRDECVESVADVGRYVSKELSKQLGDNVPKRFHRIRRSAHWEKLPLPDSESSAYDWQYIGSNGKQEMVIEECQRLHLQMVDIRTGELFDAVDLGTITLSDHVNAMTL